MNEVQVIPVPPAEPPRPRRKASVSFAIYALLAIIFVMLLRGWGIYLDLCVIAVALIAGLVQLKRKYWP